jgi:hypothetical protein
MPPIFNDGIFPYAARILVLLILSLTVFSCIWGLFKSRQVVFAAAPSWKYLLAARGVIALDDPSNGDALAALTRTLGSWGTAARRGAAIGGLVGAAIGSLLALQIYLRPGAFLDDLPWFELSAFGISLLQTTSVSVGALVGQLRNERGLELVPERSTGYNQSLRGRVSDFRATVLVAIPVLLWLATVALAILAALGLIQPYLAWDSLPTEQHTLLFALPCVAALGLIVVQSVSHVRASAPQRIFTYQTEISREVDFSIRALNICGQYQTLLSISASALLGQWIILLSFGLLPSSPSALALFFAIFFGSLWLIRFVNRRIARTLGRLGGRLTGWWWQQRAAPKAAG